MAVHGGNLPAPACPAAARPRRRRLACWLLGVCLVLPAAGSGGMAGAQVERSELGRRLRTVEAAWAEQPDVQARRRAIGHLTQVVRRYFAFDGAEAARQLDAAHFALAAAERADEQARWAASLALTVVGPLADAAEPALAVRLAAVYRVDAQPGAGAVLAVELRDGRGKPVRALPPVAIEALPLEHRFEPLELGEGDYELHAAIDVAGRRLRESRHVVSRIGRLEPRLAELERTIAAWPPAAADTDRQTARLYVAALRQVAGGKPAEVDLPASSLLDETEQLVADVAAGRRHFGHPRAGEFWLNLALGDDGPAARSIVVRLLAPGEQASGEPRPLVMAVHGAGGSENMFFRAHGNGAIVDECRRRGWLLVAPRAGGFGRVPLDQIAAAVGRMYPLDADRVFVLGHSLGATQVLWAVQDEPSRYAAVGLLAGGGVVRPGAAIQQVPIFLGVGADDFARPAAVALRDRLTAMGAARLTFREYQDVEHLMVVQEALGDVLAVFDEAAGTHAAAGQ